MKELDEALWELGIFIKTKHNEVAPGQHEFAPIYTTTNIATDQNQISMELMKSIADKHNLACLLAEKPFAGVNGSGKHNNWSLSTNTGVNLLEPGHTPHENAQFLLFLVAVIKAVNEYQDLLRITATSAGNDHRLGANEAPPAIISIFLGDELTGILDAIDSGTEYEGVEKYQMQIGVTALPHFPKDTTDRNRTSPLAFTGNKFEFRMLGSSFSVAGPNIALNTSMAEALCQLADKLEQSTDFAKDLADVIKQTYHENKRIVFNGNNYCDSWVEEAEKRGLSNLKSTVEALPKLIEKKNIDLFNKHQVLNDAEVHSRYEIFLEEYSKVLNIEGLVMIDMIKSGVIPGCVAYQNELAQLLKRKRELGSFDEGLEEALLSEISTLSSQMFKGLTGLEKALSEAEEISSPLEQAQAYRNKVYFAMEDLRTTVDKLETLVAKKHWSFPSYADILYSVM
jgi:glutamine synthetase